MFLSKPIIEKEEKIQEKRRGRKRIKGEGGERRGRKKEEGRRPEIYPFYFTQQFFQACDYRHWIYMMGLDFLWILKLEVKYS